MGWVTYCPLMRALSSLYFEHRHMDPITLGIAGIIFLLLPSTKSPSETPEQLLYKERVQRGCHNCGIQAEQIAQVTAFRRKHGNPWARCGGYTPRERRYFARLDALEAKEYYQVVDSQDWAVTPPL